MSPREHDQLVREIVARASFPFERLRNGVPSSRAATDVATIARRRRDWQQTLHQRGAPEGLCRLLAFEGLSADDLDRALGDAVMPNGEMPSWMDTFARALALSPASAHSRDGAESLGQGSPIAFEEALTPFARLFRARVGSAQLTPEATRQWQRALIGALSYWAAPGLYAELCTFGARPSRLDRLIERAAGNPATRERYLRFTAHLAAGGWWEVARRRPVLARVIGQITEHWVESACELLVRLQRDRGSLEAAFNRGQPLGPVVQVQPAVSDPHRGGRSVALLRFQSGTTVVYKPRCLGMELEYNRLLAWLNAVGAPIDMKVLTVIDQGSHGWVEHVDHAECPNEVAVVRYYRRAGQLLCLAFVLETTDCHYENLIADGEYPVLVDAEALLHHRGGFESAPLTPSAEAKAAALVEYSVLRTGLLPTWQLTEDGQPARDMSGLVAAATQEAAPQARWLDANTDRMELAQVPVTPSAQYNSPRIAGATAPVERHLEAVLEGFCSMYRFLSERRQALLAADGPLAGFEGQSTRIVFRPTEIYGRIMIMMRDAAWRLADGADAGITFELLGRAYVSDTEPPEYWPMLASERRALYGFDVPVFTADVSGDAISLDDGTVVPGYFEQSSLGVVRERLASLDDANMTLQARLIRVALMSRDRDEHTMRDSDPDSSKKAVDGGAELLEAAAELAEELEHHAIRGQDGSITWIGPQLLGHSGRVQLRPLGPGLYDGIAGISLFLSALYAVSGAEDVRALALAAWRTVSGAIAERDDALSTVGLGAGGGLGSLLYGAVGIARHLEIDVGPDISRLLGGFDAAAIAADDELDVLSGAAGAILGLLAVADSGGDGRALELAHASGRRLLDARVPTPTGHRAWRTAGGSLLSGFSHGAAGISYALVRLAEATNERAYREGAEEGIAYERSLFDPSARNWRDLRPEAGGTAEEPVFADAWCHGAPGVGLARIGSLPVLDTPLIREDIDSSLATTRVLLDQLDRRQDHLCCGNAGRIELLAAAGQRLDRPELMQEARLRGSQMLAAAGGPGQLSFTTLLPGNVYIPGLFTGAAGIGYELVRLARPDVVGSVLLWEHAAAPRGAYRRRDSQIGT